MRAPPWLAHHGEEDLDRCVRIGTWAICRRCWALWPATGLVLGLLVVLRAPEESTWDVVIPMLLFPPVLEFVGVHVGRWTYRPARVWALSPLLALALARLLYRFARNPFDPWSTLLLATSGAACGWAVLRFQAVRREEALDPDRFLPPGPGGGP
ncbi:MAG: hypothetical protein JXB39_12495 [Deltaproteobacteria bacterium]|nr:hypothetical protein [Deltaproteobacteria bacterium]